MNRRILWQDLKWNKTVTSTLFLFMVLAALLIASASSMAAELLGSVGSLFEQSKAPHFVQMHSGDINQSQIDAFTSAHEQIIGQQTVEMLNVAGKDITLGRGNNTEADSVMEIAFVEQNPDFDFLINLSGQKASVSKGEVGVPVYYMQQNQLQVGDTIRINCGNSFLELTITCFVRDVQMNPSIVTSKRFLINGDDYQTIKNTAGTSEYLIEFLLKDSADVGTFEQQYANSGLPKSDTAVTYTLYQMLNALSDGLVIAVIILIGLLLIFISMLCLRYVILGALEEDVREIGIMKAVGLNNKDIRGIYTRKYMAMAGLSVLLGYLLSYPVQKILLKNITLYMGMSRRTVWNYLIPLIGSILVFLIILTTVRIILRRLKRLTVIESLNLGLAAGGPKRKRQMRLRRSPVKNVNLFMGLQDIWLNLKSYLLLGFTYIVCVFLAITPVNLYTTLSSPDFVTYMGAGISDIRIDIQSEHPQITYEKIAETLSADPDIEQYTAFVTGTCQALNSLGEFITIKVETGDFSIFPVTYMDGRAPESEQEIALSAMNAEELGKNIGDTLVVASRGQETEMMVCGLYQDVTNGGKTAKTLLPADKNNILWYVINIDTKKETDIEAKKAEYTQLFQEARTLDMEDYLSQTLGAVTGQVRLAALCAVIISILIGILITAMFFRMILARDASQIGIMKNLGFSRKDFIFQYVSRAFLVFLAALFIGTLGVWGIGQNLAGLLFSMMGASKVTFIVNPLLSYLLCPALLAFCIIATAFLCSRSIGRKKA